MKKLIQTTLTRVRASFVAAPTFLLLYGIARWIDGRKGFHGPGTAWTVGHIMFLLGLLTFGLILTELYRQGDRQATSRKVIAQVALILGLIGLLSFVRITTIDIITGIRAKDHAAMSGISNQLNAYPSAALEPFYNFGPLLFQLGILVLML